MIGYFFHVRLGDEHALWPSKATERGIGDGIGLRQAATDVDVRDQVAVIDMGQGSVADRSAEILTPASVTEDVGIQGLKLPVLINGYLPSS